MCWSGNGLLLLIQACYRAVAQRQFQAQGCREKLMFWTLTVSSSKTESFLVVGYTLTLIRPKSNFQGLTDCFFKGGSFSTSYWVAAEPLHKKEEPWSKDLRGWSGSPRAEEADCHPVERSAHRFQE